MKIIKNLDLLQDFIRFVLPEITSDEVFLLALFARKKYLPGDSPINLNNITQLRREFAYSKAGVVSAIQEFELTTNIYLDKNGLSIPESCMAMYIMPNPRSNRVAAGNLMKAITDKLVSGEQIHLNSLLKTELHKAISRRIYLDFDVDCKGKDNKQEILNQIMKNLGNTRFFIVHTRGGAHLLVDINKIDRNVQKTFYKNIMAISETMEGEIEVKQNNRDSKNLDGSKLVPIPGCIQGNFVPYFEFYNNNFNQ